MCPSVRWKAEELSLLWLLEQRKPGPPRAQSSFFLLIPAGFRVKAAQRYPLQPFWQGFVGLASCFWIAPRVTVLRHGVE